MTKPLISVVFIILLGLAVYQSMFLILNLSYWLIYK